MLLIDGVKYQEREISNEDELEQMVIEHAPDIFGKNSIYFDKKQKLKSLAGVSSIPDGLVIMFGSVPQWHIVEVELSSHDPYDHIVPQVDKFIVAIDNPRTRNKVIDVLYDAVDNDEFLNVKTRQAIGQGKDIHKFLSDLIATPPTITIIIEKDTDQLEEALRKYAQKKVVEFQTFTREGVGLAVHAHLFDPVFQTSKEIISTVVRPGPGVVPPGGGRRGPRVTIENLTNAGILKIDQILYGWHEGRRYEGKVLKGGKILLVHTGQIFDSPSGAASNVKGSQEDGWRWWYTTRENGSECKMDELRKVYESNPSP